MWVSVCGEGHLLLFISFSSGLKAEGKRLICHSLPGPMGPRAQRTLLKAEGLPSLLSNIFLAFSTCTASKNLCHMDRGHTHERKVCRSNSLQNKRFLISRSFSGPWQWQTSGSCEKSALLFILFYFKESERMSRCRLGTGSKAGTDF